MNDLQRKINTAFLFLLLDFVIFSLYMIFMDHCVMQNKQNPPLCLPTFHNVIHLEIADVYNYKWAIVDFLQVSPSFRALYF